ncbi:MAG TPA: NAD(P)-binding domain-containing protein [Actinomycetota bacterium]|nr:NAD(P)-binding domain-containing protein [Actinomycetota bacterium]
MKIAVLGTGMVGQALAGRLADLGHEVSVGTRDPEQTRARTGPGPMGSPPFSDWLRQHPDVALLTFADAASGADLVVNATSGAAALDVLAQAREQNLAGKVLIDVSNPLDFSQGMPPTLLVKDTDSLAEQIQRTFPQARVVKTLNTMNAGLMVHPESLPETTSVFVSGDDAQAKAQVAELLRSFGHGDVIDLGDITTARGTEMVLPLWLRIMGALGTPAFNFRIVR